MEYRRKNGDMPDKEITLLRLAADAGYPGAVKAFRMADGWRKDVVARSRVPDFSDGLVSMRKLAALEHRESGPPFEEKDGKLFCEKWRLALWIWRTFFPLDSNGKN